MKSCRACGQSKPFQDFYKATADRRFPDCKLCVLADRRRRYASDEAMRARIVARARQHPTTPEQQREQRLRDPEKYRRHNRRSWLMRAYGITNDDFEQMLSDQDDRCAICREDDPGKCWSIDHDHVTGRIRGVLCWHCNVALGHFRDDPVSMASAIDYVVRHADMGAVT